MPLVKGCASPLANSIPEPDNSALVPSPTGTEVATPQGRLGRRPEEADEATRRGSRALVGPRFKVP